MRFILAGKNGDGRIVIMILKKQQFGVGTRVSLIKGFQLFSQLKILIDSTGPHPQRVPSQKTLIRVVISING